MKLSSGVYQVLNKLGADESLVKKSRRIAEVKKMWTLVVESVFLDHTNAVYIINKKEKKTLFVYVDESIFAAELNGRRELIKLKFLEKFNENLDEFYIGISRGSYKKNYPFKDTGKKTYEDDTPSIPLSEKEQQELYEQTEGVKNVALRTSLLKAMIADLEWKKGLDAKKVK